MFFRVRTQFRILVILSVIAALIVMIWVIQKPIISAATRDPSDGDIASALIPVLAAALSINLFIGMGIKFVEQNCRTMVAYLGHGMRWLKNAEVEIQQARQFLTDASDKYQAELFDIQFDQTPITQLRDNVKEKIEAADELVVLAKKHLETAENNLDHLVDSRNYQRVKWSAISYFSILLGLLIAAATSLQIFSIMGVQLDNPKIDTTLTGLSESVVLSILFIRSLAISGKFLQTLLKDNVGISGASFSSTRVYPMKGCPTLRARGRLDAHAHALGLGYVRRKLTRPIAPPNWPFSWLWVFSVSGTDSSPQPYPVGA